MSDGEVCYTFEAAVEKAIEMEEEGFRNYLAAIKKLDDPRAREVMRENALDELNHKHQLERALLEGRMEEDISGIDAEAPIMNLGYVLQKKELGPDSDVREAMAYAIHLEKGALEFYAKVASFCTGAPMSALFERLQRDERRHLQMLEDIYELRFMPEN